MDQRLQYLFKRQLLHENSPEEKNELLVLMADPRNEEFVKELLSFYWEEFSRSETESEDVFQPGQGEDILDHLLKEYVYPTQVHTKKVKLWPRIASIAAAAAGIVFALYFFVIRERATDHVQENAYSNNIKPGRQGATLTLSGGRQIRLADALNGRLAKEAGAEVSKTANGQLVYDLKNNTDAEKTELNRLSTSKGETYMVTLPDRSKVWLNAASSLTYAVPLIKNGIRSVKLEGEAYFEVNKDKVHPFVVESGGRKSKFLGRILTLTVMQMNRR